MCKVLADSGHNVVHLPDVKQGGAYDITLDGVPYDLKALSSANNIVRHAESAINRQGAKGIVFEFTRMDDKIKQKLKYLSSQGIHGYYYIMDKNELNWF